jgi:SAM-dependent methyltransferase
MALMNTKGDSLSAAYDELYRRPNHFSYRNWLYRPFIKALTQKANLRAGCRILDVGCGQGLFTSLFAGLGFDATGVDISGEAIRSAKRDFGSSGAAFEQGDVLTLNHRAAFDCVFARSLSLYNSREFSESREVTDALLAYLKPGGVLIFDYHTKLSKRKRSDSWIYHSFDDARKHFSSYPASEVYFSLRIETLLFSKALFRHPASLLFVILSQLTGFGGELVAFVPRPGLGTNLACEKTGSAEAARNRLL